MARKLVNLNGQRFGRLTVTAEAKRTGKYKRNFYCRCECGKQVIVRMDSLQSGATKSCGCYNLESFVDRNTIHGYAKKNANKYRSPEYNAWAAAKGRCNNPNDKRYADYGGRGITFCERWANFQNFIQDMGEKPIPKESYSLDRIDNDKGYSPENCRWATRELQMNNTRKQKAQK